MMNLAEYRRNASRLADFLPWAALVAPGVVLNKDGSFQRTARFRGPDLDSAVAAELVAVAGRLNNAFHRLGSGWAIFVEAQRSEAAIYPDNTFPDPAAALVDAERKADFEQEGSHFVSDYFLTLLWLPPAEEAARAESWLYEGRETSGMNPWELLCGFIDRSDRVLALLDGFMPECAWLDDGETLTYLHSTISTNRQRVRVAEVPVHLDALLADQPLTGGLEPRLGEQHLRVLTITGFPTATTPGILDELNRIAFPYRWSTRAILIDKTDAVRLLTRIRRQWFAKRKSIAANSAGQSGIGGALSGAAGVGKGAGIAAMTPLRRAAASLKASRTAGVKAGFTSTGGSTTQGTLGGPSAGAGSSNAGAGGNAPAWAQRMRGQSLARGATVTAHAVRSGDSHGPGASVSLSESDKP